ncbi:N-acyl amino acid synthase FeeM domain-containing protein [Thermodesulfatator autotrophicus]|uniref:N-acyl amino acid synthase FeeM catalytic core domain-containing protein n=1 Tax=Thermodesulfatator autotrophicus TaxID=1795632 RepID=A0A177E992_9BACT|nr:hypothetical protein [Thermodesulfatator autotrophicus]OAG27980.1 hypothetical protein TH606_03870 [Thermodesulfatator autotrophicus]
MIAVLKQSIPRASFDFDKEKKLILKRLKLSGFPEFIKTWQKEVNITFVREPKALERIYRFVHDRYIDAGIIDPQPDGKWVTKYLLFPDTRIVAAYKKEDKLLKNPLCTASIVFDKVGRGLPCDAIYGDIIDDLRAKNKKIVELCSLAALPNLKARNIYFPIFKVIYEYIVSKNYTDIVIVIKPKHRFFYEKILRFKCFEERKYSRFKNVTAMLAHLDLKTAEEEFKRIYGDLPSEYNIYLFFKKQFLS